VPHHLLHKYQFNDIVLRIVGRALKDAEDNELFSEARAYVQRNATTFNHKGHSAFCLMKLATCCHIQTIDDLRHKWKTWESNQWVGPLSQDRKASVVRPGRPSALPFRVTEDLEKFVVSDKLHPLAAVCNVAKDLPHGLVPQLRLAALDFAVECMRKLSPDAATPTS
jgi:hypothetical protein